MKKNISKKTCMFYVSDYHFEMIGLLNIRKELKQNKKIIVLTQDNLQESIEVLLSKINLKKEDKKEIEQIDWSEKEKQKYEQLQKEINDNNEVSIYIKGNEEYIQNQNNKINEMLLNSNKVSVTDCYNFMEIKNKSNEIMQNYDEKLITGNVISI